ncbi:MAG TPA: AraC family transcriptional regulator [Allosphingosinicella sp.]
MIWETKEMIAGCIDKMRQGACAGCERRDACAHLLPEALALMFGQRRSQARRPEKRAAPAGNPFFSFLSEVAKAVEARAGERKAAPQPSRFRAEVERRLEPLLASGDVGIDRVARDLGYSRQTLYRRLKAEGITYEQLLDRLRRRLALRLVREQGLPVKEAAYRLGFSDPAAFSRAFKRWTGSSPSGMRTRH